jgi:hypothetical protein
MTWLWNFCRFWYDFIVGDDWRLAVGVAATVLLADALVETGVDAWWTVPLGAALTLAVSVWGLTSARER